MRKILGALLIAVLCTPLFISVAQDDGREMVQFKVNVTVPAPLATIGQSSCHYGAGPQSLWFISDAGDIDLMVINNGTLYGLSDDCRFSETIPLNVNANYSLEMNDRELISLSPGDLQGVNVLDIQFERYGYSGYELSAQGAIQIAEPTPTPDPATTFTLVSGSTSASRIETARFYNQNPGYLFTEPWDMSLVNYTFASSQTASAEFETICSHAASQTANLHDGKTGSEVSLGRLGDETCAYLDGEDRTNLWVVIRIGNQILTVFAFAADGDTVGFVGDWLEGYLESVPGEPDTLMPTLADMPRGWSQSGSTDVTEPQGTPVATP